MYGQEAVLPWEVTAGSRHVEFQNDLSAEEYAALMSDNVEDLRSIGSGHLRGSKKIRPRSPMHTTRKSSQKSSRLGT